MDIQNDYFPDGRWPVAGIEKAGKTAARLLEKVREKGHLVLHIRHEILSDPAPFFQPGSTGAAIHPVVSPNVDEKVILKHRPNSFAGTNLRETLDQGQIKRVIVVGAMSQMCVNATARAASDLGYAVTVVHDACAAKEVVFGGIRVAPEQVQATIMGALADASIDVADCETCISTL